VIHRSCRINNSDFCDEQVPQDLVHLPPHHTARGRVSHIFAIAYYAFDYPIFFLHKQFR
jgi:hypothetical protein